MALDANTLWSGAELPPLLSSFSTASLLAARDAAPLLPRAHLFDHPLPSDWLACCQIAGAVALDADHRSLTADIIATAHAAGLRVITYTLNEQDRAGQLLSWGLDNVITDRVDTMGSGLIG